MFQIGPYLRPALLLLTAVLCVLGAAGTATAAGTAIATGGDAYALAAYGWADGDSEFHPAEVGEDSVWFAADSEDDNLTEDADSDAEENAVTLPIVLGAPCWLRCSVQGCSGLNERGGILVNVKRPPRS